MTYGEQRYKENIKELTPEQKAKQTLILEALREQTAYERKKRRETVEACKRGLDIISKALVIMASLLVLSMVVSCSKEEDDFSLCKTFDLGAAFDDMSALEMGRGDRSLGACGIIYEYEGRIKQDVCPCEDFKG